MARLVGDVGGTHTRFALFDEHPDPASAVPGSDGPPGVAREPRIQRSYRSLGAETFGELIERFLAELREASSGDGEPRASVTRACVGVAGPVHDGVCRATNLPFVVDARSLRDRLGTERVRVVNDFALQTRAALSYGPSDWTPLGGAEPRAGAPIAVLGPGTGLGVGFAVGDGRGGYEVFASEGGHREFAPRNDRERLVYRELERLHGRVSVERVVSGPGLASIARILCRSDEWAEPERSAALALLDGAPDEARVVAEVGQRSGGGGSEGPAGSRLLRAALDVFAEALGSFAGDTALLLLSEGGVYLAGGIPPRLVGFLESSALRRSFEDKGRFRQLLERIPIRVVRREDPGLLGALWFTEDL